MITIQALVFTCAFLTGLAFVPLEKCMEELGCFQNLGPFFDVVYRPIAVLPSDRASINTTFRLYTRKHPIQPHVLQNKNETDFADSDFDAHLETKIIIHGFREAEGDWMIALKDAFLAQETLNVVTVDWGKGASIPYALAATNTRVVGAELALLLTRLQVEKGLELVRVHLIGFSLGAHVAGYAGQRLNKIRRITALDPAGPLFEGLPDEVRLDPSDAQFVDAIHTDGRSILKLSFGSFSPMGHVDFYPNNGYQQPNCPESPISTISYASLGAVLEGLDKAGAEVVCRHSRAHQLFLDSVRNKDCLPVGYPCKDWDTFQSGQCSSCGSSGGLCGVMGIDAENYKPTTSPDQDIKLYLTTNQVEPFCLFHYNVQLRVSSNNTSGTVSWFTPHLRALYGKMYISLAGKSGSTAHAQLTETDQMFYSDEEYNFLLTSTSDLGELQTLVLKWIPGPNENRVIRWRFGLSESFPVDWIKIKTMGRVEEERQEITIFCAGAQSVSLDKPLFLTKSSTC